MTTTHTLPDPGEWPCQRRPDPEVPPRLVAFIYRLLRDGPVAPGTIEQICIDLTSIDDDDTGYTNSHLERYARALATHLTDVNHDGSRRVGSPGSLRNPGV